MRREAPAVAAVVVAVLGVLAPLTLAGRLASSADTDAFYAPFAAPWNVAGWPAMSVPTGTDSTGSPLAVQLVGPPGSESTLLAVARQLETAQPWRRVAPAFAND